MEKKLEWVEEGEGLGLPIKFARVVVLKHMFSLKELKEDPALLIDLKQDVWEECEKLGEVTNVNLYDLEPEEKKGSLWCIRGPKNEVINKRCNTLV